MVKATINSMRVAIVGLGYVGLPLMAAFSKHFEVVGYDINKKRIDDLNKGIDRTLEVDLKAFHDLEFTNDLHEIVHSNFYIITVPTPIDKNKTPDLSALMGASTEIGSILNSGDIVVYESTVFPGAIEEICVPILNKSSSMDYNIDFFVGYSPERINPGDKSRDVTDIIKVTSGGNERSAAIIDQVYSTVIKAGTHKAANIKVAEASKVIENVQRDINIALMNELSRLFDLMDIDTKQVLDAASTKWNFLNFRPGLVGGHCIGVDPYYLTFKASELDFHTELISASRRINDQMPKFVCEKIMKHLIIDDFNFSTLRVLLLGCTFKEDCPDIRNSKVFDLYNQLVALGIETDIYDPIAIKSDVKKEYGVDIENCMPKSKYDLLVFAVRHEEFLDLSKQDFEKVTNDKHLIFDLKYCVRDDIKSIRL